MNLDVFCKNLDQVYLRLRNGLANSKRDYEWRVRQLEALRKMILDNNDKINAAMWKDLRKGQFECVATEQGVVLAEIDDALKHLKRWMKPIRVHTPIYNFPGSCEILHDPLGLALIIGAWNYPINLTLAPLVGAIAGGNAVILKPSELADASAKVLAELIPKYMDQELIAVIEAGPEETSALLDRQFDTIFFTGSGNVGKIVMGKAAAHLTPVTLELGGKSPAMVLNDANLEVVARRITWGKYMNAGQTCVAPDYILVQPEVKAKLIELIRANILKFYGEDPKKSQDYCRIVNARNFDRLSKFLTSGKIVIGGQSDATELYIAPTVMETTLDAPVMQEEIFGPILPIIEVATVEKMIEIVNARPKPLSLYLFTQSEAHREHVLSSTSAGGVCINDVVMHMPVPELPFGGVGASGMGHYHGEFGFKTFTHSKGVLRKGTWLDVPVRYAPYTIRNMKILRWLF